jgi:hypothetical protein
MTWLKLAGILVLALVTLAVPMASAAADWSLTGAYVDNTTANFQMLSSNAQYAAWVVGHGNRPGFDSGDERVTCYMNYASFMAAKALGNQVTDVPILTATNP